MRRDIALTFLIVMASALCWLPVSIEPSLDLPPWIPPLRCHLRRPGNHFVPLLAVLACRKISITSQTQRTAVWVTLLLAVAFGPSAYLLTPPLVRRRVASNDQAAAKRFAGLKNAVEETAAQGGDPNRICDGSALRKQYAGPPFSDENWKRIADNYVKQQGYMFMIYCHQKTGYTIDVRPARNQGDGTRQFCTDESRPAGCQTQWNGSRYACLPCLTAK